MLKKSLISTAIVLTIFFGITVLLVFLTDDHPIKGNSVTTSNRQQTEVTEGKEQPNSVLPQREDVTETEKNEENNEQTEGGKANFRVVNIN